jgi:hypothetical protein
MKIKSKNYNNKSQFSKIQSPIKIINCLNFKNLLMICKFNSKLLKMKLSKKINLINY